MLPTSAGASAALVFSRWSTRRPGVAITTCGRLASAMASTGNGPGRFHLQQTSCRAWSTMAKPPTTVAVCSLMVLPMAYQFAICLMLSGQAPAASNCSPICTLKCGRPLGTRKSKVSPRLTCRSSWQSTEPGVWRKALASAPGRRHRTAVDHREAAGKEAT